jgi:TolB-like protein/tetratricopeptide (TPR) repeat protein
VGQRLGSWKEIAAYLERDVRTVQRWARDRRLPVHRLPGGPRPRVFSLRPELDAWLQGGPSRPRPPDEATSVAVLPFLNLTGAPEGEWFGDGLADDVINALVHVPGLRVTARTSSFAFAGQRRDVRKIGARLNASWLLEGSVRRHGERVRVSAQLVSARDGCHAWSESYDRRLTDVLGVQDDIAHSIALALQVTLSPGPPAPRPAGDLAAYHLWTKGRSYSQQFTGEAFGKARRCFEAALALDPRFARAHHALAELLFYGAQFGLSPAPDEVSRVRQEVVRAVELDPHLGEAHALLGVVQGHLGYEWGEAEASFARALELCPGSAAVLSQHAWYHLVPRMRIDEALAEAQQAAALDPLSPFVRGRHGLVLVAARQYARAAGECRRALQLANGLWWLHWFYGTALLLQGRTGPGVRRMRMVYEKVHQPLVVGGMALVYGLFDTRGKARQMLAELEAMARRGYVPPAAFALAYVGLGDDRAFEWFGKAIDAHNPIATHLPFMPLYDGLRKDPRFRVLLAKMNLV